MITRFKIFENSNQEPEVGDYVVVDRNNDNTSDAIEFLNNNIGRIFKIALNNAYYGVRFEKDYKTDNDFFFDFEKILFYSKSKAEAEAYLASKKYNL